MDDWPIFPAGVGRLRALEEAAQLSSGGVGIRT